jgi:transposase, IS5 family
MLYDSQKNNQIGFFSSLEDQLNTKHPLVILSQKIRWQVFEECFSKHYCTNNGRPSKPIRLMCGLLILKHLRNLSDENLVEHWSENVYYQYFCGEQYFQCKEPCAATELIAFRHRIGEEGVELLLKESIRINKEEDKDGGDIGVVVSIDTTIQEKNITYPTDDKLYKKIIKKCWKISEEEGIDLRQSYRWTIKRLGYVQRMNRTKYGFKKARKANKKIKVIAGRLVRELARKLSLDRLGYYLNDLKLYQRVISQRRTDTDKIYSLHEPHVKCYTKGKEHKKYEFGSKVSIVVDQQSGVILGAINFTENIHDSKTVPEVLEQVQRLHGEKPKEAYVDRGYRGISQYEQTRICVPKPDKRISKKTRRKHSRRSAIEPKIGHLKFDHRLKVNFLKGILGDQMNIILAACALNFKRVINLWRTEAIFRWLLFYKWFQEVYSNCFAQKLKLGF